MCAANSRRICLLCLLLYCVTCVKSSRNPNVPRGRSRHVDKNRVTTTALPDVEDVTEPYYMEKGYFVGELMKKYGDGNKISFEGLEHLLYNLGLGGIDKFDHGIECHKPSGSSKFLDLHSHHDHSKSSMGSQVNSTCAQYDTVHSHHDHVHEHDDHEHGSHNHGEHDHDHETHDHAHDGHDHENHDHAHNGHDHADKHTVHDEKDDPEIHTHSMHKHEQSTHDSQNHTYELIDDVSTNTADTESTTAELNVTPETVDTHNDSVTHADHEHGESGHHVRRRSADHNECLSAEAMVKTVRANVEESLTVAEFKELCPSLIFQLDADSCDTRSHESSDHDHFHGDSHRDHDHDHDHGHESEMSKIGLSNVSAKVWGFSTIAVVIISLVGLLGVAVIPIMQKVFYNHLLQFLVALAVGALSGDALLHLIPHAMGNHDHNHSEDDGHSHVESHEHDPSMIYKGLCALMGIYFTFWTERLLTIFTEYKRKKKEKKNRTKKHINGEEKIGSKLADQCDGMMMSIHPNKALQNYALEAHKEHCTKQFDDKFVSHCHGPCPSSEIETPVDGEERISMIDESPAIRHGHGHSHGIDGVPTSVASVAWMVILGDGIHNFCDGLAIGAAFVNGITGGFSTSIAVLCHELPHEIGDFAMLLRAGMTAKQAIFYNIVSSILCFVGMLVGVAIGNVGGATLWVFALVGGMFLYIALVDMLPELSSVDTKKGEHPLCHLLLQCIGMLLGAGIMLIIALYEEDLITVLG